MRKISKAILLTSITIMPLTLIAQNTINPGDTTIHYQYLKNQNVFHKLCWLDKNGKVIQEAVLNLITRIDTVKHTLTYIQLRNDAKKDSSVSTYPGLKPLYLLSRAGTDITRYDYSEGHDIKVHTEQKGKANYDGVFTMPDAYFDSFLCEYILGALPIEKLKPLQFEVYQGDTKKEGIIQITKIMTDVFLMPNGNNTPVFVLNMKNGVYEFLVYVDQRSRQVLKTVFALPRGGYFTKSLI
jgi:hypothetical protein